MVFGGVDLDRFREGLTAGELLLGRCHECGAYAEPRARVCPVCRSPELEAVAACGRARVVSWTRSSAPDGEVGRTFVIAQLQEGPWWWGELVGAQAGGPARDEQLTVEFRSGPRDELLPSFRAADDK
jgi:uncharacterized OB-fold protein